MAYCMIRHFKQRLIIEVGSGFSSLVASEAMAKNEGSALIYIEPFPLDFLREGFPGLHALIEKKVQDIDVSSASATSFYRQLAYGQSWR